MPREKREPAIGAEVERQPVTPMRRFLRALTAQQKREFATDCGTTVFYLQQLAAHPTPNPALRLAKAITQVSRIYGRRVNTAPLTYDDLLIGCSNDDES